MGVTPGTCLSVSTATSCTLAPGATLTSTRPTCRQTITPTGCQSASGQRLPSLVLYPRPSTGSGRGLCRSMAACRPGSGHSQIAWCPARWQCQRRRRSRLDSGATKAALQQRGDCEIGARFVNDQGHLIDRATCSAVDRRCVYLWGHVRHARHASDLCEPGPGHAPLKAPPNSMTF